MNPIIEQSVLNTKLNITFQLFAISKRIFLDEEAGTISGQVKCFKSKNVADIVNAGGTPKETAVANFTIKDADFSGNPFTTTENYVRENLESIINPTQ